MNPLGRRAILAVSAGLLLAASLAPAATAATDSDRDGLPDSWERQWSHTNPSRADTDGDGRKDGREDPDGDRLTNRQEYLAGMNPLLADSDNDGIRDDREDIDGDLLQTWFEFRAGTSPRRADSDGDGRRDDRENPDRDGLSNRQEYLAGMHPRMADTDRDGVRDEREDTDHDGLRTGFEFRAGTAPTKADTDGNGVGDGQEDPDQDALSNRHEYLAGMHPRLSDSDGDGLRDDREDTDRDGLRTLFEFWAWTHPRKADTDGDGTRDRYEDPDHDGLVHVYEQRYGTNPRVADTDGDGWKDGVEVRAGTDPLAASSQPTAPVVKTVRVTSIAGLRSALGDDSVDEIVVANGTYHVSPSKQFKADSLWIGGSSHPAFNYAKRTRPITVRAETRGGVTFDGGGGSGFAGLSFEDGAHHQTWDGFRFANMAASSSGIIEVGGYTPRRTPHHITLRNITIAGTCTGQATTASGNNFDHGVYVSNALVDGPHDLLFENFTVSGAGYLASAFHFYHGDAANPGAHEVLIRNLNVTGTQTAILLWEETLRNITIDGFTSTAALAYAIRYEPYGNDDLSSGPHASGMVVKNSTSTGPHSSGYPGGFFSSRGTNPIGMTLSNNSLR